MLFRNRACWAAASSAVPRNSRSGVAIPVAAVVAGIIAGGALESNRPFYDKLAAHASFGVEKAKDLVVPSKDVPAEKSEPVKEVTPTPAPSLPPLPYLSDRVFETTDDMLVFMFPSEEKYLSQSEQVKRVISEINKKKSEISTPPYFQKVKLYFTIVPPANPSQPIGDNLGVMCYKGQRKQRLSLEPQREVPMSEIEDFFKFISNPVDEELTECVIQHISGDEFESEILNKATRESPIILQVYEKSCFLCFLMRPLLNSLAELLKDEVPFTFKRLDIEANDFPDGLPVVRGTPTFIFFTGRDATPVRFEEFKPRDLVKRISQDFPVSEEVRTKMFDLVDRVALRFQAFSGLIMWGTEAEKILQLMFESDTSHHPTIAFDLKSAEDKDKELFNKFVSEFMSEDMVKTDKLDDNISGLMKELNAMEKHAVMMGQMLGEKVREMEQ